MELSAFSYYLVLITRSFSFFARLNLHGKLAAGWEGRKKKDWQPVSTDIGTCPSASIVGQQNLSATKRTQILDNVYNKNVYYGFDYSDYDNHNYLKPLPSDANYPGANVAFNLSNEKQHPSASLNGSGNNETAITPVKIIIIIIIIFYN